MEDIRSGTSRRYHIVQVHNNGKKYDFVAGQLYEKETLSTAQIDMGQSASEAKEAVEAALNADGVAQQIGEKASAGEDMSDLASYLISTVFAGTVTRDHEISYKVDRQDIENGDNYSYKYTVSIYLDGIEDAINSFTSGSVSNKKTIGVNTKTKLSLNSWVPDKKETAFVKDVTVDGQPRKLWLQQHYDDQSKSWYWTAKLKNYENNGYEEFELESGQNSNYYYTPYKEGLTVNEYEKWFVCLPDTEIGTDTGLTALSYLGEGEIKKKETGEGTTYEMNGGYYRDAENDTYCLVQTGDEDGSGGNITVNGGTVTATGGEGGAGIGGGEGESGRNVTINGGTVTATGGKYGAGIGGCNYGSGGFITVNGGTVVAIAGANAQAIGHGAGNESSGNLFIPYMKVYVNRDDMDANPDKPVSPAERETVCRSGWAGLKLCPPDHVDKRDNQTGKDAEKGDGFCDLCGLPLGPVEYWDPTKGTQICDDYIPYYGQTVLNGRASDDTWYVVYADTWVSERITVSGNVSIILMNDKTLTAEAGITVLEDDALTLWAQCDAEEGSHPGKLFAGTDGTTNGNSGYKVTCADYMAGIGGTGSSSGGVKAGKVTVNGGIVTATGGKYGAGIGGGNYGSGGFITVNGGTVVAIAGVSMKDPDTGAQAIGHGVGSDSSGSLSIDYMKVYKNETDMKEDNPVSAVKDENDIDKRTATCRSSWAGLKFCPPDHIDELNNQTGKAAEEGDGYCDLCGGAVLKLGEIENHTYDGKAYMPELSVSCGGVELDKDFSVVYKQGDEDITEPTNAGDYIVIVTGTGDYARAGSASGSFTIKPVDVTVTITGVNSTAPYDGEEHSVSGYTAKANNDLYDVYKDFTFNGTAEAAQTDVGIAEMGLAKDQFENTNDNFNVTFNVTDGYQTVEPINVTVTITGHKDTATYDGEAHTVNGYEVKVSNPLYKEADFTFSGTAEVSQTDAGTASMGLAASQFTNTNNNFNVNFDVTDGYQTIEPNDVTVTITGVNSTVPYDGEEHSVSGYTSKADRDLYDVEKDFTFSGTAEAAQTEAGTDNMGLKPEQFTNTNPNFDVTFVITDGYQIVLPTYTVSFVNSDGTVLQITALTGGAMPEYDGETPVKDPDAENHYIFAGWDEDPASVTGMATYTATYKSEEHDIIESVTKAPTCTEAGEKLSICKTCGYEKTEETPANGHDWNDWKVTKEPEVGHEGEKQRVCSRCGETETETVEALPAPIVYTVTDGADGSWTQGGAKDFTLTVKRSEDDANCFSHYKETLIDGKAIAVTAKSGSTVVTISAGTLEKLSAGTHTVTVKFDDGEAETKLTVNEAPAPEPEPTPPTGDSSRPGLWTGLLAAAVVCIGGLTVYSKKRRKTDK